MKRKKIIKTCPECQTNFETCWADICKKCSRKINNAKSRGFTSGVYSEVNLKSLKSIGKTKR